MRVFVVLALFCVCNADVVQEVPSVAGLDVVKNAFWDYVAKVTQSAEESLSQVKASEFGQEVNTKISQSMDTVTQYVAALKAQAAPVSEGFITQVNAEAQKLKEILDNQVMSMSAYPDANNLRLQLEAKVEELKKEVTPYTENMDPEALKTLVGQRSQELKTQLEQGIAHMKAQMVPVSEQVKQGMEQGVEEFQKNLILLSQSYETQLSQKSQELQQTLEAGGEELKAKLEASAQDLQAQLSLLWESFTKINTPPAQ